MSAYSKPQQLDVRKFIRLINSGFNTQLNEAAGCVRKAGKKVNRDWKLVALNGTELLFEDATSDQYILAKYTSKPTPKLSDITPIEIVDEGKQDEFADACKLLVEAVESEDKKADIYTHYQALMVQYRDRPHTNIVDHLGRQHNAYFCHDTTFGIGRE